MTRGCQISEAESCLSVKIFLGHVDYLINQTKSDYIFVPRVISLRTKHLSCPKFFGLPDLVKLLSPDQKILFPIIDYNKKSFQQTVLKIGQTLDKSPKEVKKAYQTAYRAEMSAWQKKAKKYHQQIREKQKKIVLISHPYNLYDEYINLRLVKKIEDNGLVVITIDSVPYSFEPTFTHWDFAAAMINQVKKIANQNISGAIQLSTFNCGCDSVIKEFIADEFKRKKIPYLPLIIDEHTGQAGLQTRIEAFADTLK